MTKRQLIDEIVTINHSARPGFLARFEDVELDEYLRHLIRAQCPRIIGDAHRYDHYFEGCPVIANTDPPAGMLSDWEGLALATEPRVPELDDQDEPPEMLDLNVSPDAIFKESYEADSS